MEIFALSLCLLWNALSKKDKDSLVLRLSSSLHIAANSSIQVSQNTSCIYFPNINSHIFVIICFLIYCTDILYSFVSEYCSDISTFLLDLYLAASGPCWATISENFLFCSVTLSTRLWVKENFLLTAYSQILY